MGPGNREGQAQALLSLALHSRSSSSGDTYMIYFDAQRPSDSPFVERVWCSHSEGTHPFLSIAVNRLELVVSKLGVFAYPPIRTNLRTKELKMASYVTRFSARARISEHIISSVCKRKKQVLCHFNSNRCIE